MLFTILACYFSLHHPSHWLSKKKHLIIFLLILRFTLKWFLGRADGRKWNVFPMRSLHVYQLKRSLLNMEICPEKTLSRTRSAHANFRAHFPRKGCMIQGKPTPANVNRQRTLSRFLCWCVKEGEVSLWTYRHMPVCLKYQKKKLR